ncbi:28 kDa heat- and acid-stable phosphoprotein [Stomoxys calcitrans]|uniref:Casein kinase substrate phosphoprotein PP28 domain-containing protein n=1 Tax=Stomoxys calcitrans TaxID=35570 RepID=A0A1I8PWK5_STOCA|nr:28 kDa heat- and acid-stable phosphoprotein [Stomoxys calcitrans]
MPRGKYVNHKGRSRHFTSPEEMQQQSEDESSSEESGEEEEQAGSSKGNAKKGAAPPGTLPPSDSEEEDESSEDDRDAKKGVAGLIEIENPNRAVKKVAQKVEKLNVSGGDSAKPELTRREREQIEKQKARLRYEKLHADGKTAQAKSDLARLALIRQQRADAAAKREAEKKLAEDKKGTTKS